MTRKEIVQEFKNRGYFAEPREVVKNGVELRAVTFSKDENAMMMPTVYTDELIREAEYRDMTVSKVVDCLLDAYENLPVPESSAFNLNDKKFVTDHLTIIFQKSGEGTVMMRDSEFDGIKEVLCVCDYAEEHGGYLSRVPRAVLETLGISEEEAWRIAKENTIRESCVISIRKELEENREAEYSGDMDFEAPMYLFTNKHAHYGAAAILNKDLVKKLGEKHQTDKLLVFPSSVHEFIVIPYIEWLLDINEASELVRSINHSEVSPVERLTDQAYLIEI